MQNRWKLALCVMTGLLLAAAPVPSAGESPVTLTGLTAEHERHAVGIGESLPRLSWKLTSERAGEKQAAYELRGASDLEALAGRADIFDTGRVESEQSVLVPWPGKPLESRARVYWQARIWDKDGKASAWSEPAVVETGLLNPGEWKGEWITVDLPRHDIVGEPLAHAHWIHAGSAANQAAGARVSLDLPANAKVLSAVIDASADGLIALYVNGQATKQGPSSHTAPFHADFGAQLSPGKNVLALFSLAVRNSRGGGRNAMAAHILIELEGGGHVEVNTDERWKADLVLPANWYARDFDDSAWAKATVLGPYVASTAVASADSTVGPGRYLRKTFVVNKPVSKARLYSTALGTYEASLNGKPVNDHLLDPGWTDYAKRVMVQTTDVTALLSRGQNTWGVVLTDGWFAGRVGWMGLAQYASIGKVPLFNAQLEITYADGTREVLTTDKSWKGGGGAMVGSDQQLGEVIDARLASAWDTPAFKDEAWAGVIVQANVPTPLVPQVGPPVRKIMELTPQEITRVGNMWLVDLGQNMVGHIRLSAQGPAGTVIHVSHGEMLNADGTFYNENLRQAIALDTFTLKGTNALETFEPHFTFHGFRYVQIDGYPGILTADNIRGIVIGSDTPDTGTFETSSGDVNRLFQNIRWGQRGNFISVPTDCPQRDERMGWMGDAQAFASTAARNANVAGFFSKWLTDVNDGQGPNGEFNNVNPRANQNQSYPVWGDAGVIIPWDMYMAYGDKGFLEKSYPHMTRWVEYLRRTYPALLTSGGVGDHLAPAATPGPAAPGRGGGPARGAGGVNVTTIVDTAYFARSAWIASKSASVLGHSEDAATYDKLYHDIAAAFNKAFVQADGSITGGTQTTYLLAFKFELLPENMRAMAAKHLIDDVEARKHLSTGFVGVGYLNPGLTALGRSDLAYQLLFTDTYPSWLFPIRQGATTMWERWDGYTPQTGFQASSMNSFNHYSFGAVGQWLYSGIGGIGLDEAHPGYKQFTLEPQLTTHLSFVKVTLETPYGMIYSAWRRDGGKYLYHATVPPNTTGVLTLPTLLADQVGGDPPGLSLSSGPYTLWTLPPGTYHFSFSAEISPSVRGYK